MARYWTVLIQDLKCATWCSPRRRNNWSQRMDTQITKLSFGNTLLLRKLRHLRDTQAEFCSWQWTHLDRRLWRGLEIRRWGSGMFFQQLEIPVQALKNQVVLTQCNLGELYLKELSSYINSFFLPLKNAWNFFDLFEVSIIWVSLGEKQTKGAVTG